MAIKVHCEGTSAKAISGPANYLGLLVVYPDTLTAGIADVTATAAAADHNARP